MHRTRVASDLAILRRVDARIAADDDLGAVTELLTGAFEADPVWGWAMPDRAALETWWRFIIRSSLRRHDWVWVLGDFAAVAMWIPPGLPELTAEEDAEVEPMIGELVGERAPEVMQLLERFEAARPEAPHYYLSLLGTDPARRGNGYGMALLDATLEMIDADGAPAYLESSNPANDARYERRGFRRIGAFDRPDGAHTVARMWRDPA